MKKRALLKHGFVAVFFSAMFGIVGCGDSITENSQIVNQSGFEVVDGVADLPKCTSENNGQMVWLSDLNQARACSNGDWYAITDTLPPSNLKCYTEPLKDKSGLAILCNGDSIGVVLNGSDGTNGKPGENGVGADGKDGAGCSVKQFATDSLKIKCGSDSVSISLTTSAADTLSPVDSLVLDSEAIVTEVEDVGGYSQKGPFLMGSAVKVVGLLNGRTLKQTGNIFEGRITNDKGEFNIKTVKMPSQYAILVAEGYYLNEITGEPTESKISLNALTNLKGRTNVNVNILTHLEYDRAFNLVTKHGLSVRQAKDSADREVLGAFHLDAMGISGFFEDFNVGGTGDGDAALLAISILLQNKNTVSGLQTLVSNISSDLASDGFWNDDSTRAAIADWASDVEGRGLLDTFRTNVASWGFGHKVANFEPLIQNYWRTELGLGSCGDSVPVGTIAYVTNERSSMYAKSFEDVSKSDVRFICAEKTDGTKAWRPAIAEEKDTYQWDAGGIGERKTGKITGASYVYGADELGQGDYMWRTRGGIEDSLQTCTPDKQNQYTFYRKYDAGNVAYGTAYDERLFQCKNGRWVSCADKSLADTAGWGQEPAEDGLIREANVERWWENPFGVWGEKYILKKGLYVYDEVEGVWRLTVDYEKLGQWGCTTKNAGKIQLIEGEYFMCRYVEPVMEGVYGNGDGKVYWHYDDDYKDESVENYQNVEFYPNYHYWSRLRVNNQENLLDEVCNQEVKMVKGKASSKQQYVCENGRWRDADISEERIGQICTSDKVGSLSENKDFVCREDHVWSKPTFHDFIAGDEALFNTSVTYDSIEDERDGQHYRVVKISLDYVDNHETDRHYEHTWMAENLRYSNASMEGQYRCQKTLVYDDKSGCAAGGLYYTWTAAMNYPKKWQSIYVWDLETWDQDDRRGICPEGYHVPNGIEWGTLYTATSHLDDGTGKALFSKLSGGTDELGLNLLKAGYYTGNVDLYSTITDLDKSASYWTAEQAFDSPTEAWCYGVRSGSARDKSYFVPVRCMKDYEGMNEGRSEQK